MTEYNFKIIDNNDFSTPISNIFIDEYLPYADGNFVKVYIYGLKQALYNGNINSESMSKKLSLLETDIVKAWNYWQEKGLLKYTKNDNAIDVHFINLSSYNIHSKSAFYTPDKIDLKMNNPLVKDMFDNIQKLLGKTLSQMEISMYISWLEEYLFSPEVVMLLIEYCKSKNKTDTRYLEKVALNWHNLNIKTIDDAQKQIKKHEEKYNKYRLVLDFLGLKENDLMKPQQEFLDKWFEKWQFNIELVLEACRICSIKFNEPNFNYIDGILSNWYEGGIKSLKDLEKQENKKTKSSKIKVPVTTFNSYEQRSYNIKELENTLLGRDEVDENE